MNICHVITRLIIGGAQENTVLTCRGLAERGHRVTLVAGPETGPEGSLWSETVDAGFDTVRLDALRRAVHPLNDLKALGDLRRLFRDLQPDIVHTHSSKAGILARRAASCEGVPIIVHTIHGMSFNRTQPLMARMFYRRLERRAARYTTAFITVADAMIEQAIAAGVAPRERFTTIRSGMDVSRYVPDAEVRAKVRSEWGVEDNACVIGTVARLFANKGYEELMSAMPAVVRAVPQARFVWIGDGSNRSRYERKLDGMGMRDRVHFVGLVPPNDVPRLLNGVDLLVHASRWEGLPRAVVQALLMEVPAVSFDNDGAPEVIIPGETGSLVPFGDTDALAGAMIALARDPELRCRLGRGGRKRCLVAFDWRRMVADIEALYARLTATGHVTRQV